MLVPWMSGLVSGLQNRVRRFESARNLKKEVCRNVRYTFFFIHYYTTRFIFFKLRYFEDFFDLCVRNI